MSTRKRFLVWLAAVAVAVMTTVSVGTPAQAWSYCTAAGTYGKLILFYEQGYCSSSIEITPPVILSGGSPVCMDLPGSNPNARNFAGSLWNRTSLQARLHPGTGCNGSPNATFAYNTSHPNLCVFTNSSGYWLYHNSASVLWYRGIN